MMSEWRQSLLDHAEGWGLPTSGQWDCLFYNNYHPHITTINLLWFHDGSHRPQVVTKIFRDAAVPKREFENLERAYSLAPQWTPRPLYFGARGGFWELWILGVPGFRVSNIRSRSRAALRSLAQLVSSLHGAFAEAGNVAAPDRYERSVRLPLKAVADFGASARVGVGCARISSTVTADWIQALPQIPQHGDLYLGNLLCEGDQWRIVDWESFGIIDLPFYDLVTLLLSVLVETGRTPREWDDALTEQIPGLVGSYFSVLRLPWSHARLLLPLVLMNWFYLQLCDGRSEFAARMYCTITHYFEHTDDWERVFTPR